MYDATKLKFSIPTSVVGFSILERLNVFSNFPESFIRLRFLKNCFLALASSGVLVTLGEELGFAGAVKFVSIGLLGKEVLRVMKIENLLLEVDGSLS